jgi:hypothetical protein
VNRGFGAGVRAIRWQLSVPGELKNKYDPNNFFRMNRNIKPTVSPRQSGEKAARSGGVAWPGRRPLWCFFWRMTALKSGVLFGTVSSIRGRKQDRRFESPLHQRVTANRRSDPSMTTDRERSHRRC